MGASNSKAASDNDPVVFYNDALTLNVPVRFSPNLVRVLETPQKKSPTTSSSNTSSEESSISPSQSGINETMSNEQVEAEVRNRVMHIVETQIEPRIRETVEARVKSELAKIEGFRSRTATAVVSEMEKERDIDRQRFIEEGKEQLDSNIAIREVDGIIRRAGRATLPMTKTHLKPSDTAVQAQNELKKCLFSRPGTPLDCHNEVRKFKESLKIVQKEFMEQAYRL